jgi:type IV secretion system protein VirB10
MINARLYPDRDPRLDTRPDELNAASFRSAPEVGRRAGAAEGLGLALGLMGAAALGGMTILSLAHHRPTAPSKPAAVVRAAAAEPIAWRPTPMTSLPLQGPAPPEARPPSPSPVLVVDNSSTPPPATAPPVKSGQAAAAAPSKPSVFFSQDEQFAARAGEEAMPTSHVHKLDHPDKIIAQGAVIPAILETPTCRATRGPWSAAMCAHSMAHRS